MSKIFKVKVLLDDEYFDDGPDYAKVEIFPEQAQRIFQLAKAVTDLGVYSIQEHDYTPDYMIQTGGTDKRPRLAKWEGNTDAEKLKVTEDEFCFIGLIRHTNIDYGTEYISIKDIAKVAVEVSPEKLPTLLGIHPLLDEAVQRKLKE